MNEKIDYLFSALDFYITMGVDSIEAWHKALEDYKYVYHTDDGRTPLARAAERALQAMGEDDET